MKNIFAKIFILTSTLLLANFLYTYADTSINITTIESKNGFVNLEFENPGEVVIKYAYNPYFINSQKEYTTSDKYMLLNSYDSDVYIKIYSSEFDVGLHKTDTYKVLNHEHTLMHNPGKSILSTCKESGKDIFECTECDHIKYNTINPLGCNHIFYSQKNPTCTEEGFTIYRCERCGETQKHSLGFLEHQFEFVKNISKSTCTKQGVDLYACLSCKQEKEELLEYTNHSYKYDGDIDGEYVGIRNKCSMCGKTANKTFKKQYMGDYFGMLHIPAVGVTVPVYCGDPSQAICDAVNSASLQLYSFHVKPIIADHNYQGFTKIRNARVGSTIMYYQGQKYICSENFNGTNTGYGLIGPSGTDIKYGPSQLYLYTCNDKYGKSIRIVGWNRV